MIGQNVQLTDIFCYLGGFLYNTGGWSKPKHKLKHKDPRTVHQWSLTWMYVQVKHFAELPGNNCIYTFQSSVMCPSGCTSFLHFRLLSLTCFVIVLPAPCEFRDTCIKQLVTALSQHSQLAERTKRHLDTHCHCTCSWPVTELTQQNLITCVSFCDRYQLIISACFFWPFL